MLKEEDYFVDISRGLNRAQASETDVSNIESKLLRFYNKDVNLYKEVMYFIGLVYTLKEIQEKKTKPNQTISAEDQSDLKEIAKNLHRMREDGRTENYDQAYAQTTSRLSPQEKAVLDTLLDDLDNPTAITEEESANNSTLIFNTVSLIYKQIFKFSTTGNEIPVFNDKTIFDIIENNDFFIARPFSEQLSKANEKFRKTEVGKQYDKNIRNMANKKVLPFFTNIQRTPEFIEKFKKQYTKYISTTPQLSDEMFNLIKVAIFMANSVDPNASDVKTIAEEFVLKAPDNNRTRELASFAMGSDVVRNNVREEVKDLRNFNNEIKNNIILKFEKARLSSTISNMFLLNKDLDATHETNFRIILKDIRQILIPIKEVLLKLKKGIDKTAPIYLKGSSEEIIQEIYRTANLYYQQNVARQPDITDEQFVESYASVPEKQFARLKFAISQITNQSLESEESKDTENVTESLALDKKIYVIDLDKLKTNKLNESWIRMFGSWMETILSKMLSGFSVPVNVRGSRKDVEAFGKVFYNEKRYLEIAKKYGLDHPTTYASKSLLDKAVSGFEKETGLKWPFS